MNLALNADIRLEHFPLRGLHLLALCLALTVPFGCGPKTQQMLVVSVQGDVFLPDLRATVWYADEDKHCQIASLGSVRADSRGDLLLCGNATQLAWSQSWLRKDIRDQIYANATNQTVHFHNGGHPAGEYESPFWLCKKASETIECE